MKRLAFAIGVVALGLSASTAARADYAVVMFKDGYCRVWNDRKQRRWRPVGSITGSA